MGLSDKSLQLVDHAWFQHTGNHNKGKDTVTTKINGLSNSVISMKSGTLIDIRTIEITF